MTNQEFIDTIAGMTMKNYDTYKILPSITIGQAIIESGWGKSKLSTDGKNLFGMKAGKTKGEWGSVWDGVSIYTAKTEEEVDGKRITITANFKRYPDWETSVKDHDIYLSNFKYKGSTKLVYDGIKNTTDYKKQAEIIYKGGYATASNYVEYLCKCIEKYNLVEYDKKVLNKIQPSTAKNKPVVVPFKVRVTISNLCIRDYAGTNYDGKGYIKPGEYTVVATAIGEGSKAGWGKLKSGEWISLDYVDIL